MTVEARLWQALRGVEDPEIPISVVGMGLIVSVAYRPEVRTADLQITYTAMGCPAMEFIEEDIREACLADPEVDAVEHRGRLGPGVDEEPDPGGGARGDAPAGDRGVSNVDRTDGRAKHRVRWEVFARKAYEDPLHHVGTITEPDEDLALVSARAVYDEHPWIEMIIVPRSAIREAIAP